MTPITDKIKQLPDEAEVITSDAPIRYTDITADDLKALVSELETMKRALKDCRDNCEYCRPIAQAALKGE